jgi:hypothetical protein
MREQIKPAAGGSHARGTKKHASVRARELVKNQPNKPQVWIHTAYPERTKRPELVLWVMVIMLLVKFAIILFR